MSFHQNSSHECLVSYLSSHLASHFSPPSSSIAIPRNRLASFLRGFLRRRPLRPAVVRGTGRGGARGSGRGGQSFGLRRRMGWQSFWWIPSIIKKGNHAIISLRLHFLALLFNNSNSNKNHNLGKICIPPNLECKKENRSVSGAKHGAFHCSPHPQINLQPKWESQICCFRSSFSSTKPSFFSSAHVDRVTWGPTNHFGYERLVHPIILPTCAAKFFSGPPKIYPSLTQVVLHGHFLGSFGCFISHLGKRSFFGTDLFFWSLRATFKKWKIRNQTFICPVMGRCHYYSFSYSIRNTRLNIIKFVILQPII